MVLVAGQAVLWLGRNGRQLIAFAGSDADTLALACRGLHGLPWLGLRQALVIEQINSLPAASSPLAGILAANGFVPDYRGLARDPHWQANPK